MKLFVTLGAVALGLLMVSPVVAADLASPAAEAVAAAPAPTDSWTGPYLGAVLGYGWGQSKFNDGVDSNPFSLGGVTAGVTAGVNYQLDPNWVVGVEGDVSYSAIQGSFGPGNLGQPNGSSWTCTSGPCNTDIFWYSTARARAGYVVGNALLYATGGLAIGQVQSQMQGSPNYYVNSTNVGWVAGGGVEYAFDPHWTTKLEYTHVDLGWTAQPIAMKSYDAFDTVRVGLNYKF